MVSGGSPRLPRTRRLSGREQVGDESIPPACYTSLAARKPSVLQVISGSVGRELFLFLRLFGSFMLLCKAIR